MLLNGSIDAAIFMVENADDAGLGSLRQAILSANALPGPDEIPALFGQHDGMHQFIGIFLKGVILGLGAAVPIGPVNVEIARRTLRGHRAARGSRTP